MRKLISFITSIVLVMSLTGSVLATEPNFGGEGNFNSGDVCGGAQQVNLVDLSVNEDGWRILTVSGSHHQGFHRVDASGNAVTGELDTILPAGTYFVAPDVLGTGWTYTAGCDPTDMVNAHIARRVADPTVNTQGMLVLPDEYPQVYELFVPVDGNVNSTVDFGSTDVTVEATYVEPTEMSSPADSSGVITSGGFGDEDYSNIDTTIQVESDLAQFTLEQTNLTGIPDMSTNDLCSDDFADELGDYLGVERNNRDYCNEYAGVEDMCVIGYLRGPLDRLPELSSSGAGNIFTVNRKNGTAISWFPHGRATFQPGPTGERLEAGIFCTYDQIMGWINQNMGRMGASQYVDWQDLGFMSLDTYNIPGGYYGGTEDPDTAKDCRPLGEDRIFEQIRKGYIDAKGYHVHGSPWVSGVSKERQVVIPASDTAKGNLYWNSNVQGAVRLYPADRCSFEEVLEQARVHHNARGKAHSALVVKNWKADAFTSNWFSIR